MKRCALLAAVVTVIAALVPAGLAAEPNGKGLFREHRSVCTYDATGDVLFEGYVTLVPGSGMSFWAGDHHLVIQSFEYTPDGGATQIFPLGQKTGQVRQGTVTCKGHFPAERGAPAYDIVSHDVVVP